MGSLTRSTLAKIESGVREFITVDELVVIADVLGVPAADLIGVGPAGRSPTGDRELPTARQRRSGNSGRIGTAVCPWCFSRFNAKDVLFRCRGELQRAGRHRCPTETDHDGFPVGPLFKGNVRQSSAECPNCGIGTTSQVCPLCHRTLPLGYTQSQRAIIAVVGGVSVGKTIYITALLHELRTSVGERLRVSAAPIDDKTERHYVPMEQELFVHGRLLPNTERGDCRPLMFDLAWNRRFSRHNLHRSSLVLYDPAGEDATSRYGLSNQMRYLANADGVIFVVDPTQITDLSGISGNGASIDQRPPGLSLSSVAQVIRSQNAVGPGELIDIPIAVTVSKADLLHGRGIMPRESQFFNEEPHHEGANDLQPISFSDDIASMVRQWDEGELQRSLDTNFSRYAFFAVSALGTPPSNAGTVQLPVRPVGVTDPLMWLFRELHIY